MIIDMHAHLWATRPEKDKALILREMERFSLQKVLVSTLQAYVPEQEEIRRDNLLTWGFMKEQPGRIEGYCYLNPRNPETLSELRTCVEDRGFCGVKLWCSTFCDDPLVDPVVEQCIRYDIPILIHAFYKCVDQLPYESLGENVARLARRYPEARLIMAHLGAACLRELRPVQHCPNVWADFSGSINHADDLAYAKKLLGADRLLFGSDMPGIDCAISYTQCMEAELTEEERRKILGENARRLFRFAEGGAVR